MDANRLDRELTTYIRPLSFPLAIKFLKSEQEIPEKTRRPVRDLKKRVAICQAYGMARKLGWVMALGKEDMACSLGAVPFGFHKNIDYYLGGNLCEGMFSASAEAGKRSEAVIDRLPFGVCRYLLIAPLSRAAFDGDVVLVYGLPAQIMRLIHGVLYLEGGALTSSFEGRLGCAAVIAAMKKGASQVLIPGNGDRIFGMTQDHEVAFAIPWDQSERLVEGLIATHKAGIRYPIPSFFNFEPLLPPSYRRLDEIWREEEGEGSAPDRNL